MGGMSEAHCYLVWLTFISQAGVSLGLASEVAVKFHSTFGRDAQTAIIAVIIINQLIGPVLSKYALKRANECDKAGDGGSGSGDVSNDPSTHVPDLELSYDQEDDDISFDGTANPATISDLETAQPPALHPRTPTSTRHHRKPSTRTVQANQYITNAHGQRIRKTTRKRALVIGCSAMSLAAVQRLICLDDGKEWSVVVLDESLEGVARAASILRQTTSSSIGGSSGSSHLKGGVGALPSLRRAMHDLAHATTRGLESGLDSILPASVSQDERPLMETNQASMRRKGGNKKNEEEDDENENDNDNDNDNDRSTAHPTPASSQPRAHSPRSKRMSTSNAMHGASKFSERKSPSSDDLHDIDIHLDDDHDDTAGIRSKRPSTIILPNDAPVNNTGMRAIPSIRVTSPSSSNIAPASLASPISSSSSVVPRIQVHRIGLDQHPTYLDAYKAIEEEFFLSHDGIDAVLIDVPMDSIAYDLTVHLIDLRRFHRVLVRVKHPAWARVIEALGAVPLYPVSIQAQIVAQIIGNEDGKAQTSTATSSSSALSSSASTIAPHILSEFVSHSVIPDEDFICTMQELETHQRYGIKT